MHLQLAQQHSGRKFSVAESTSCQSVPRSCTLSLHTAWAPLRHNVDKTVKERATRISTPKFCSRRNTSESSQPNSISSPRPRASSRQLDKSWCVTAHASLTTSLKPLQRRAQQWQRWLLGGHTKRTASAWLASATPKSCIFEDGTASQLVSSSGQQTVSRQSAVVDSRQSAVGHSAAVHSNQSAAGSQSV